MRTTVSLIVTVLVLAVLPIANAVGRPAIDRQQTGSDIVYVESEPAGNSSRTDWALVAVLSGSALLLGAGATYAVTRTPRRANRAVRTH